MKFHNIVRLLCFISVIALSLSDAYALKIPLVIVNNNTNQDSGPLRLMSATPYDKQTLDIPPTSVSLTFSQSIKPDKSSIKVYDALGNQLDTSELQAQGKTLSVSFPELSSGKYSIKWRARCQCDDDSEISDDYHFIVR